MMTILKCDLQSVLALLSNHINGHVQDFKPMHAHHLNRINQSILYTVFIFKIRYHK